MNMNMNMNNDQEKQAHDQVKAQKVQQVQGQVQAQVGNQIQEQVQDDQGQCQKQEQVSRLLNLLTPTGQLHGAWTKYLIEVLSVLESAGLIKKVSPEKKYDYKYESIMRNLSRIRRVGPLMRHTQRSEYEIPFKFAAVGLRIYRTKGCLSKKTALTMVFKLIQAAEKKWQRIQGYELLPVILSYYQVKNSTMENSRWLDRLL